MIFKFLDLARTRIDKALRWVGGIRAEEHKPPLAEQLAPVRRSWPSVLKLRCKAVLPHLGRQWLAYIVLLSVLLLTYLIHYYVEQNVEAQSQVRFDNMVRTTELAIDRRMTAYMDMMIDARSLFATGQPIDRTVWASYIKSSALSQRYPGIEAIGYASRVTSAKKDSLVMAERKQGFPDYAVRSAGERADYFPMTYIEPLNTYTKHLLGYDPYGGTVSHAAMDKAVNEEHPVVSGRLRLLPDVSQEGQTQFLICLPVYSKDLALDTPMERDQALQGFIISVFRTDELLKGIFGEQIVPTIDFEVYDGSELTPEHVLHDDDHDLHARNPAWSPHFWRLTTLAVGGRRWTLYFTTLPSFERVSQLSWPRFVGLGGLGLGLLLGSLTSILARNRRLSRRVSADRARHEIQEAERTRIARDLHDLALQDLVYAIQGLQITRLRSHDATLNAELDQEIISLRQSVQGLRSAIYDLRSDGSRDHSFIQSLEVLVEVNRRRSQGTEIQLVVQGGFPDGLRAVTASQLLCVLQEALVNVRRHAAARNICITLRRCGPGLQIEVADDGCGFSPGINGSGVGLMGMRERLVALGAQLDIQSVIGQGTRLAVTLPHASPMTKDGSINEMNGHATRGVLHLQPGQATNYAGR